VHMFITHTTGIASWACRSSALVFEGRPPFLFDGVHFPVKFADLPATIESHEGHDTKRIGSMTVRHIALNHPGGAVGFRFDDDDGTSLCYLTDNEFRPPARRPRRSTISPGSPPERI
jgi:hypothetical protein